MMEAVWLKAGSRIPELASEFPFPERKPTLDGHVVVFRRAKEMDVIGHNYIGADHPSVRFVPSFQQRVVNHCICQLSLPLSRADCDKDDRGPIAKDENAFRGVTPLS
jgi:hypothetical protein